MYYKLFSSCIITIGASRISLCDLVRSEILIFDSNFSNFFQKLVIGLSISEVESSYESLIEELIEYNLIFKTEEPESFPEIETTFNVPCQIHNAIVSVSNKYDFEIALLSLMGLLVRHIEIRVENGFSLFAKLVSTLEKLIDSSVHSITFIVVR